MTCPVTVLIIFLKYQVDGIYSMNDIAEQYFSDRWPWTSKRDLDPKDVGLAHDTSSAHSNKKILCVIVLQFIKACRSYEVEMKMNGLQARP